MSRIEADTFSPLRRITKSSSGWRELWLKEDWWAIWLGLGIVIVAYRPLRQRHRAALGRGDAGEMDRASRSSARISPTTWPRYVVQFLLWLAAFSVALGALGHKPREFLPAFVVPLSCCRSSMFVVGQWDQAQLLQSRAAAGGAGARPRASPISFGLPRWLDAGFRVEFYIKTGIVLLGATLPFTLIVWAGPVAILQASIVSIVTFLVIYWVGAAARARPAARRDLGRGRRGVRRLGRDRDRRRGRRQEGAMRRSRSRW